MGIVRTDKLMTIYASRELVMSKLSSLVIDYSQVVVARYRKGNEIFILLVTGKSGTVGDYEILSDSIESRSGNIYTYLRDTFQESDLESIEAVLEGSIVYPNDKVVIYTKVLDKVVDVVSYIRSKGDEWIPLGISRKPISGSTSNSIELNITSSQVGDSIEGEVKISSEANNSLSILPDGLYSLDLIDNASVDYSTLGKIENTLKEEWTIKDKENSSTINLNVVDGILNASVVDDVTLPGSPSISNEVIVDGPLDIDGGREIANIGYVREKLSSVITGDNLVSTSTEIPVVDNISVYSNSREIKDSGVSINEIVKDTRKIIPGNLLEIDTNGELKSDITISHSIVPLSVTGDSGFISDIVITQEGHVKEIVYTDESGKLKVDSLGESDYLISQLVPKVTLGSDEYPVLFSKNPTTGKLEAYIKINNIDGGTY